MFEIKSSPGKGLGVFATTDIPRGKRLILEQPLLQFEQPTAIRIYHGFLSLSEEQRQEYLSLTYAESAVEVAGPPLKKKAKMKPSKQPSSKFELYTQAIAEHNRPPNYISEPNLDEGAKVVAIFHNNAFHIRNDNDTRDSYAIFPEAARINHSCLPNAVNVWNKNLNAYTVHAMRDIISGEEIGITYSRSFTKPEAQLSDLEKRYGFRCSCAACDMTTKFGRESAKRRERLRQLELHLDHSTGSVADVICAEMLELLEAEGSLGIEKCQTYANLGNFLWRNNKGVQGIVNTEKAVEIARDCFGPDQEITIYLEQRLDQYRSENDAAEQGVRNWSQD